MIPVPGRQTGELPPIGDQLGLYSKFHGQPVLPRVTVSGELCIKKKKESRQNWVEPYMPEVPATLETEAGGLLKSKSSRPG